MKTKIFLISFFFPFLALSQSIQKPEVPKFLLVNHRVNPVKEEPDMASKTLVLALENSKIEVIEILEEFIHCRYNGFEGFAMKSRVSKTDLDGVKEYFEYEEKLKREERIQGYYRDNEERLKTLTEKFDEVSAKRIMKKEVWIGMNENMLLESWGKPLDVNTTVTANNTHKQYVYSNSRYVYTDNGIVTAIQY